MSATLDSLNDVLANVTGNKTSITAGMAQVTAQIGTVSPDVQAAIDLLRTTFSANVQQIGTIIGQQIQLETMQKTSAEIDALIAVLQVAIADEGILEATEAQQVANAVVSPLPSASGTGDLVPSTLGSSGQTPAPAAQDGSVGTPSAANS